MELNDFLNNYKKEILDYLNSVYSQISKRNRSNKLFLLRNAYLGVATREQRAYERTKDERYRQLAEYFSQIAKLIDQIMNLPPTEQNLPRLSSLLSQFFSIYEGRTDIESIRTLENYEEDLNTDIQRLTLIDTIEREEKAGNTERVIDGLQKLLEVSPQYKEQIQSFIEQYSYEKEVKQGTIVFSVYYEPSKRARILWNTDLKNDPNEIYGLELSMYKYKEKGNILNAFFRKFRNMVGDLNNTKADLQAARLFLRWKRLWMRKLNMDEKAWQEMRINLMGEWGGWTDLQAFLSEHPDFKY